MEHTHIAFYATNSISKKKLINSIKNGELVPELISLKIEVFSEITLNKLIAEEKRHGEFKVLEGKTKQSLLKYSEGERKKELLEYLISKKPTYLILDNPFDNLDSNSQKILKNRFIELAETICIIQISNRKNEVLPIIDKVYFFKNNKWSLADKNEKENSEEVFVGTIPEPYQKIEIESDELVKFNKINVSYNGVSILSNVSLKIKSHEFWQITGENGAGKSTLLSLITGDNVKGYGQDITLFGIKKGSGESVWEHKRKIGYFSSEMKLGFARKTTLENMILSGFFDSVGLYDKPSKIQIEIMVKWLRLLGFYEMRKKNFIFLTLAQQRMVLIARAMIKHPPLLILDEPTAGLDDASVKFLVTLINKIYKETETTIIYVSHKKEVGLKPLKILELNKKAAH